MARVHLWLFKWVAFPAVCVLRYGLLRPFRRMGWPKDAWKRAH